MYHVQKAQPVYDAATMKEVVVTLHNRVCVGGGGGGSGLYWLGSTESTGRGRSFAECFKERGSFAAWCW